MTLSSTLKKGGTVLTELGQIALRCMRSYLEIFVCFVRKKCRKEMSEVMGLLVL